MSWLAGLSGPVNLASVFRLGDLAIKGSTSLYILLLRHWVLLLLLGHWVLLLLLGHWVLLGRRVHWHLLGCLQRVLASAVLSIVFRRCLFLLMLLGLLRLLFPVLIITTVGTFGCFCNGSGTAVATEDANADG